MYNSQLFGITDYARCLNPLSYFHDGWDPGLTKTTHKYINKHGYPCNNWYRNVGTWMNPVAMIEKSLNK